VELREGQSRRRRGVREEQVCSQPQHRAGGRGCPERDRKAAKTDGSGAWFRVDPLVIAS